MDSTQSPDWLIHAFLLHKRLRLLGNTTRQAKIIGALVDLATVASHMAYHLAEKPSRDQLSQYTRIAEEVQEAVEGFEGKLGGALATFGQGGSPATALAADMELDHTPHAPDDSADASDYYDDISPTQIVDLRPEGMSSPAPYPLGNFEAPAISCDSPDNMAEPPKKLSLDAESMNKLVASLLPSLEPSLVPAVAWFLKGPVLDQLSADLPGLLLRDPRLVNALAHEVASKLQGQGSSNNLSTLPRDAKLRREPSGKESGCEGVSAFTRGGRMDEGGSG